MKILLVNPDSHKRGSEVIKKITPQTKKSLFNTSFQPNLGLITLAALTPRNMRLKLLTMSLKR